MFRAWFIQRWPTGGAALALAVLGLSLLVAACTRGRPEPSAPPKTVSDWFTIKVGGRPVQMQIALTDAEMARGLMERRALGPDQGMLFVYRRPAVMSFWMRDVFLPLDIGFFTPAGELQEVYAMYPHDENTVRARGDRLQYALEMNQDWFHGNHVGPGARLDLTALRAALTARGASPADYGLPPGNAP